jgi:OmpA-OmpF porin, OOP family
MGRRLVASRRLTLVGLAVVASITAVARPSRSDPTPSLALSPAPAGDRAFLVERAGVHGHLLLSARIVGDYAQAPLTLRNGTQDIDRVVTQQTWAHALLSLSVAHRFLFSVSAPLLLTESGDPPPPSGGTAPRPGGAPALGDLTLGARAKIFGTPPDADTMIELAVAATTWLPTGSEGYTGDGAVRARGAVLLEVASKRLYWVLNGGARTRPSETLPGILPTRVGSSLVFGGAAGFFADRRRRVSLGAEVLADLTVGNGASLFDPRATVVQTLATGHYRVAGGPFEVGAALGPGLGEGAGSAAFRVLALVGFAPERPAPAPDRDRDGVPDKTDTCIDSPGVASPEPLLNGCPEAPLDRDEDGIPDAHDACPTVPGKPTYVPATHGCPKPPAPASPPVPVAGAELHDREIVIGQQVQFETESPVLRADSEKVLDEVAAILKDHLELELVEVQGHTDDQGTPERNRQLAQERAASVVEWLVAHGVDRGRLQPKGYGSDRPLADNAGEQGRQKNRRVELHILERRPVAP